MARGGPSLTALLGLLAVAGYQHRDKIGDLLKRMQSQAPTGMGAAGNTQQNPLGGLLDMFAGSAASGTLLGGLKGIVDAFRGNGYEAEADSWVGGGTNRALDPQQVRNAFGDETLREVSQQTGLSEDEILSRLSTNIPVAVDDFTRDGKMPREEDMHAFV